MKVKSLVADDFEAEKTHDIRMPDFTMTTGSGETLKLRHSELTGLGMVGGRESAHNICLYIACLDRDETHDGYGLVSLITPDQARGLAQRLMRLADDNEAILRETEEMARREAN